MATHSSKTPSASWVTPIVVLGLCFVVAAQIRGNPLTETPELVDESPEAKNPPPGNSWPVKLARDPRGLHNVLRASETVYSGSEPHGEPAFASLNELGIKTIVSVDGARPDVETAKKYGIRYVHVPIGYDGIPERASLSLSAVMRTNVGPVYVHCHHGRHRGPAAAAILCMAIGNADPPQARKILELAQTGKEYAGLWRDVANYRRPPFDAKVPELVEVAEVDSLASAMAQIDRCWDLLKLCRDADWKTPQAQPDISPAHAALLVSEGLHEANRALREDHDDGLEKWLADAETIAQLIEADLKAGRQERLGQRMTELEQSCKTCHAKYRN